MAEIVNLKQARKEKARREQNNEADANRLLFGRTKAQKAADKDAKARRRQTIEGKKLDPEPTERD
jgi:hypothetical protein